MSMFQNELADVLLLGFGLWARNPIATMDHWKYTPGILDISYHRFIACNKKPNGPESLTWFIRPYGW